MRAVLLVAAGFAFLFLACGGSNGRAGSTGPKTEVLPSPTVTDPLADAQAVEADPAPDLPGEYVNLPQIYGGFYGNSEGSTTAPHVQRDVDYSEQGLPPAGGPHWGSAACGENPQQAPPFCGPVPWGIYRAPWQAESLVHNMEHAGVVIWYNTADQTVIADLEDFAEGPLRDGIMLVLAPYPDMEPDTIAITVWSRRDRFRVSEYGRERLQEFIDALYCRFDPEGFCGVTRSQPVGGPFPVGP